MGCRYSRPAPYRHNAQVRVRPFPPFASSTVLISNWRWLKQVGLDTPDLGHLKRIRKQDEITTLLLGTSLDPPKLPADLNLSTPYLLPVPTSSALTLPSLNLKSALWPTLYTPRRKDEPEPWTRRRLRWAWDAMKKTVDAAIKAQTEDGEVRVDSFEYFC